MLLATAGLEYAERSSRASARTGGAFLVLWAAIIWMYVAHRDTIPMSQAFLRASTVPMVLAGLGVLFQRAPRGSTQIRQALVATLIAVGVVNSHTYSPAAASLLTSLDVARRSDPFTPRGWTRVVGHGSWVIVAAQFVYAVPDPRSSESLTCR